MIRFMNHISVNLRGHLIDYLKSNLSQLEKDVGDRITFFTPHDEEYSMKCKESWLIPSIEKGILPDVILAHATEFASLKNRSDGELFSDIAGKYAEENPIREELAMLKDPKGLFYPLFVVPLVMCYNTKIVNPEDLKHSWTDLFNEKYKVYLPSREKPMTRAIGAFLKKNYPQQFARFDERAVYKDSPKEVMKSVISGECHIAVSNISFATMGQNKNVALNLPSEGVVILPVVMAWKNNSSEKLKIFADLLMQQEIQDYLGGQGNWPSLKSAKMGDTIKYMDQLKNWEGWDAYIKAVSDFDAGRVCEK